jgi:hypothetical protein
MLNMVWWSFVSDELQDANIAHSKNNILSLPVSLFIRAKIINKAMIGYKGSPI